MKGKNSFTKQEQTKIRRLLGHKVEVTREEQKRIRKQLREIGFYISDYESFVERRSKDGFSGEDFEYLKATKKIEIV